MHKRRVFTRLISLAMSEDGAPIAWPALQSGTPIYASDGAEIGRVSEVIADREKDIFSGLTFKPGLLDQTLFIPADNVAELTDTAVRLDLDASQAERFEPYEG